MSHLGFILMIQNLYKYDIQSDIEKLIVYSGLNANSFRGKKILVTGGTGFFGIWMLATLIALKKQIDGDLCILCLSRSPAKFIKQYPEHLLSENVNFIEGDIKTFHIEEDGITHLIHMAATNADETFAGEDQLNKLKMLYEGTSNVLTQCGSSLEKVLFTSSGVAYGINHNNLIREVDYSGLNTTDKGAALGLGKLVAEYLINFYSDKLTYKFSIARCFAFAGPYLPMNLHYAFGNFVNNALNGENIRIKGDGSDLRSYLYIGDAIAWLLRLLDNPINEIYNVGSQKSISINNLALKIAKHSSDNLNVVIDGIINLDGNFRRASYIPSTDKITSDYKGLQEWTTTEEIIEKMLNVKSLKSSK